MAVSTKFWATLNAGWPEGMEIPTDKEAINGVKRMYRAVRGFKLGRPCKVVRNRGRRTWMHRGTMVISPLYPYPKQGWPAIVHDLSHFLHVRENPRAKPHDSRQARIERHLQEIVITKLLR